MGKYVVRVNTTLRFDSEEGVVNWLRVNGFRAAGVGNLDHLESRDKASVASVFTDDPDVSLNPGIPGKGCDHQFAELLRSRQ
jgi:hypothetical protein